MKHPTSWHDVTVYQWQELAGLQEEDEQEQAVKTIAILSGETENSIRRMSFDEVARFAKATEFLRTTEIPIKQVDKIKASGNFYRVNYDVKTMPTARYVEVKHFGGNFIENIHKIAASMVMPTKKTFFGYAVQPFNSADHEKYANDLLTASIPEVMGALTFFYEASRNWISSMKDSLISEMARLGMTQTQAETMYTHLCSSMDGYTRLPLLPTMSESR
jgi:hypothetical protein